MNDKIQQAIDRGDLISIDDVIAKLPKSQQLEIARRARFIQMAMIVRKLRKQLNLTQAELAKIINKKREFLSRIESGRQREKRQRSGGGIKITNFLFCPLKLSQFYLFLRLANQFLAHLYDRDLLRSMALVENPPEQTNLSLFFYR